ncbi:MAG: 1-deoxy-D-xylulose-5-phosphate reductoisomerase, partial [Pseudomonadota bacterium]|nr:1-deoxy-D-xylulose-5-phosphate reductoisomerase [Pseudomonadota bacterium]
MTDFRKKISIFGGTGSIGTSTIDLVRANPDRFEIYGVTAHSNVAALAQIIAEFSPEIAVISNPESYSELVALCGDSGTELLAGEDALVELAAHQVDLLVAGIVGLAGMNSVHAAIRAGQNIALANKETLVAAGHIIMAELAQSTARILPIDSEHNAIYQCLMSENSSDIKTITLTASGGPFRDYAPADLAHVTIDAALAHPNWEMGPKVTIDSASMMNKGLELIEAYWLFGLKPEQIGAVIHPQSAIHGLVEFNDGSWLAHLGIADMRVPISHALGYPERLAWNPERLDLVSLGNLEFKQIDRALYPCFASAVDVIGTNPANAVILNAANEVAVDWFLKGKITFT